MNANLRPKFFNRFACVLFFIFVINTLAHIFFWYQSFSWFDDIMHFLGGVAGGLFLLWFLYRKYKVWDSERKFLKILLVNSVLFLVAATLWEVMEFSVQDLFDIGTTLADKNDSVRDLIYGLFGNMLVVFYYFAKRKNG